MLDLPEHNHIEIHHVVDNEFVVGSIIEQFVVEASQDQFCNNQERQKCIDGKDIWKVSWTVFKPATLDAYSEFGYYVIYGSTLENCLNYAPEYIQKKEPQDY